MEGIDEKSHTALVYIHGCIDDFSRRIIWLKVGVTNKQAERIAYRYLLKL